MGAGLSKGAGAERGFRLVFAAVGGGAATACSISSLSEFFAEGRIRRRDGVSAGAAAFGGDTRLCR
jgi:hypothetical protein